MNRLAAETLDCLASGAEGANQSAAWPVASLNAVQQAGAMRWSIPVEYGGLSSPVTDLFHGHEQIAAACLTTAFILSQRESAIRQLIKGPQPLRERYLPGLAANQLFATVGLSQLTTSRQHGGPALLATAQSDGRYLLQGEIPWVTGADQADVIIVGATLDDGAQLLFALPTSSPGISFSPPLPLAALTGSRTSVVHCDEVIVEPDWILAGPTERVLGSGGGGGLETSNLALGLATAATSFLEQEMLARDDVRAVAAHFRAVVKDARSQLHSLIESSPAPEATLGVREECTRLALRVSQTSLLVAKGAGFVSPHPAQRWCQQALFFLVWSCPRPVVTGVLNGLLCAD
ncbi:acyl-CoA dehydrogenase [bacterium]|nr:acyl-CoA dehydrogenase [bacterium]